MDFDVYLKEQLKDPKFRKGFKRAGRKLELEIELNNLLQQRGIKEFFVEVKNASDY